MRRVTGMAMLLISVSTSVTGSADAVRRRGSAAVATGGVARSVMTGLLVSHDDGRADPLGGWIDAPAYGPDQAFGTRSKSMTFSGVRPGWI